MEWFFEMNTIWPHILQNRVVPRMRSISGTNSASITTINRIMGKRIRGNPTSSVRKLLFAIGEMQMSNENQFVFWCADEAECELNCKPVGMNYFATLNDRVIDGTSCLLPVDFVKQNHSGRAMCVEGVCKVSIFQFQTILWCWSRSCWFMKNRSNNDRVCTRNLNKNHLVWLENVLLYIKIV